jgi:hypothetical protein
MSVHRSNTRTFLGGVALAAIILTLPGPAFSQQSYPTPEAAVQALVAAARSGEKGFADRILGPGARDLVSSGDEDEDKRRLATFLRNADEAIRIEANGENRRTVVLGTNGWPFPIPIARQGQSWSFDLEAGRSELINRTIGFNELSAIEACRTYVQAQREYFREDHDGDELQEYAQRLISSPGKRDGLYWTPAGQADRSPLDGRFSESVLAGARTGAPYHGYHFRILRQQGPAAPGGAFSYVLNGHMIAGFALVAFPAQWGKSGVMTFICNMQGRIYQRDLGANTLERGRAMTTYNPGSRWAPVP